MLICRTTAKEKSRRKADTFSRAYEAVALIFRDAVSFFASFLGAVIRNRLNVKNNPCYTLFTIQHFSLG